jgi:FKBP-type peptidyl-prolyl cis-trans isomerase FklB
MQSRHFAVVAGIFLGAFALVGCGQQEQTAVEEPAAEPETPEAAYDLSPESNAQFLADNQAKDGVMVTPSGLQYRVIEAGDGEGLSAPEDIVTVSYKGWLIDGTVFDETDPGQTIEFPADGLIAGWVEALGMMHVGDKWELVIPSELGYGAFGAGGVIPPNQTLVFEMELMGVTPSARPGAP